MKKSKTHTALAPMDYTLLSLVVGLLAFGLIVLYSASTVISFNNFGTTTHYIIHQMLYGAAIGLVLMYICSRIDYHLWLRFLPALIIISLLSLILVKIPGIGFSTGGASRWIHLGPLSMQPSELAKLVIILYLAAWTDKKQHLMNDFYFGLLPTLCIVGLFSAFILIQPDFGTMLVLISVAFLMIFVSGINLKYYFWTIVAGMIALYGFIKIEPYRAQRLTSFLNPTVDLKGIGYQINQALLAIGAGGAWGYGYGLSRQKYNYLPEAMSDSIFAVLAEELGFIRAMALLVLFFAFAVKGINIAKKAPDLAGKMIGIGIVGGITLQALINIGAMVKLLPLTGIPLPFFSYGSSSLLLTLASMGILLNISRQASLKK